MLAMMHRWLSRVSGIMTVVLMFSLNVMPSYSYASAGQFTSNWVSVRTTASLSVQIPKGNWVDVARIRGASSSTPRLELISGERWITLGREEVGMLGISSGQAVDILKQSPGKTTQLFARYSPENAQLRITMVRVEPRPDGYVYMSKADWTPHHGEYDRAYRQHLTPTEKANRSNTGYNPFDSFRGSNNDPVFYNVDFSASLVAIGHAMRMNGASVGWLAVSTSRLDVQTKESGNVFRKTITTTVDGLASPVWYLITPSEMQPYGSFTSQICASPSHVVAKAGGVTGETTCDAKEHVVQAGVVACQWNGGNLPTDEDNVYHWETSKSSLSILSYVIITVLLFWAGALAFGAIAGNGAGVAGAAASGGTSASGLIAGLTPLQFAGVAGGIYAAGSTGLGTNAGITYAQGSYAGSTGSGVLASPVSTSEQQAGLAAGVRDRHIENPIVSWLSATREFYEGNCAESSTSADCELAGANPGTVVRADGLDKNDTTKQLRDRYKACWDQGYRGSDLAICAAPNKSGTFSNPN